MAMSRHDDTLDGPRIAPRSGRATALVVLLHGYGANGDDLIALAEGWRTRACPTAAFVAPERAGVDPGNARARCNGFHSRCVIHSEYWRGVVAARPAIDRFIDQELARLGSAAERLVLVGFSQGTMLALHVALRRVARGGDRILGPACRP